MNRTVNVDAFKKMLRLFDLYRQVFYSRLWPIVFGNIPAGRLTPNQITHLMHIRCELPCNLAGVMRQTGLSSSAASLLIDKLENAGIVRRTGDCRDKRNILISFTPESRKILDYIDRHYDAFFAELLSNCPEDEVKAVEHTALLICRRLESVDLETTRTWAALVDDMMRLHPETAGNGASSPEKLS